MLCVVGVVETKETQLLGEVDKVGSGDACLHVVSTIGVMLSIRKRRKIPVHFVDCLQDQHPDAKFEEGKDVTITKTPFLFVLFWNNLSTNYPILLYFCMCCVFDIYSRFLSLDCRINDEKCAIYHFL